MSLTFLKTHKFTILLVLTAVAMYWAFAYDLQRWDFAKLITLYGALFFVSYKLLQFHKTNFRLLAGIALLFRLAFLFAIPNLSQDFYRFIWDGRLLLEGLNPYLSIPDNWDQDSFFVGMTMAKNLIEGMGSLSAGNFTSYPPVSQFCYAVAAWIGGKSILGSVMAMRGMIIAADFGTLFFGRKLLKKLNLPEHRIFWFILNPFIIIELTGNLHFEGVMLFFLVWGLYLFFQRKWAWAAVLIGLSVSVKLLPLIFLPLFVQHFQKMGKTSQVSKTCEVYLKEVCPNLALFYILIFTTVFLTFLPFLSTETFQHFSASLSLWFQKFEFNASVYYLIRWIGYQTVGWNLIGMVGKILPVVVLLLVLGLTFFRKNKTPRQLLTAMLFVVCGYFLLSTTIHPWYIATPLLLSVFTKYRFVLVWSLMVFFSYSAYEKNGVEENLWLVALEYLLVAGFFLWEVFDEKALRTKKLKA